MGEMIGTVGGGESIDLSRTIALTNAEVRCTNIPALGFEAADYFQMLRISLLLK